MLQLCQHWGEVKGHKAFGRASKEAAGAAGVAMARSAQACKACEQEF